MRTSLYNLKNEVVGELELPESVFAVPWKPVLVRQVIDAYLANQRRPWAHAKGRSEVRGGGRKPWRQKGTGRARHGSIRSPLWRGGGKAHGPQKERDYSQKINRKMKRLALFTVISRKFKEGEIKFFKELEVESPKTKILAVQLKNILGLKKNYKKYDALLVPGTKGKNIFRAARNLPKTGALRPESLNAYELLRYKNVLIDEDAVPAISKNFKV